MIGVVLGALVAAAFAFVRLSGDDDPTAVPEEKQSETPSVSPTPTPGPTPSTTPRTTPAPTPAPSATKKPAPRLPALRAATPRRLFATGLLDAGFDDSIEPAGDRFTTRSTAELSRWGSRAVPASPAQDTVFIAGRVTTGGAFANLPRVRPGARVSIRTDAGVLSYTVRTVASRTSAGITDSSLFRKRVPGRLVLIGVRYGDGGPTGTYVVVTAELTGVNAG